MVGHQPLARIITLVAPIYERLAALILRDLSPFDSVTVSLLLAYISGVCRTVLPGSRCLPGSRSSVAVRTSLDALSISLKFPTNIIYGPDILTADHRHAPPSIAPLGRTTLSPMNTREITSDVANNDKKLKMIALEQS
ncbi:hypothetical protein PMIN03_004941 [Paraphaeosphaeria minitans]